MAAAPIRPRSSAASPEAAPPAPAIVTGALRSTIGAEHAPPPGIGLAPAPSDAADEAPAPLWSPAGRLWSFSPPSRLGGPKRAAPAPAPPINGEQLFLRKAHDAACTIFGTVLGPEANNAHRNHFHVDMAERRSGSFCQ